VFSLNNDSPPSISNLPLVEQFKLIGIYESGMAEYDDIHAYINFSTAADFFELENEVTGYNINLINPEKIDNTKLFLSDILSYPFYVRSFKDINKHIFTWLELQQKPVPIVLGLIIIVAVFNIVGAVLMLIVQKTSAIGVLRSMGVNSRQILQIFLIQGLGLALIGIVIGNFLAITLSYIQNEFKLIKLPEEIYYLSSVPININLEIYFLISLLGLLLSLITSLIPSYIASRIQPLTAIKFN
ncbi:MAG: FtsX-like permease family protein, partial [Melioribacteraceae bacterium]|nr:FtsX-like permease family protein [Melioribacteraceae bacterium]